MNVVNLDGSIALRAANLSLALLLPMADSVILAATRACDATLCTRDERFKDVGGVRIISKDNLTRRIIRSRPLN